MKFYNIVGLVLVEDHQRIFKFTKESLGQIFKGIFRVIGQELWSLKIQWLQQFISFKRRVGWTRVVEASQETPQKS